MASGSEAQAGEVSRAMNIPTPASSLGVRKRGSVRFAPYFRVQIYQQRIGAWKDIKGKFATKREARKRVTQEALPARVREISMDGIRIL